jgi:hypothetical protein
VAKSSVKRVIKKNGTAEKKEVSELGRILTKLVEEHRASGAKLLSRSEVRREVAARRNG